MFLLFSTSVFAQDKAEVFFDFNQDEPNSESAEALNRWIMDHSDAVVTEIDGYCDAVDANEYNRNLALRRIGSVLRTIDGAGIKIADSVKLRAIGEDFAMAEDDALNRRVDIFYRKPVVKTAASTVSDNRPREEVAETGETPEVPFEKAVLTAKAGDIVRIQDIHFYLNSEVVVPESEPRLEALYRSMVDNPKLSIEIHGHICCNPNINDTKLSYRRAKYIFSYLLKKGIPLNRLAYKGFGSARPIYKIPERTLKQRAANRRVEILIVKI